MKHVGRWADRHESTFWINFAICTNEKTYLPSMRTPKWQMMIQCNHKNWHLPAHYPQIILSFLIQSYISSEAKTFPPQQLGAFLFAPAVYFTKVHTAGTQHTIWVLLRFSTSVQQQTWYWLTQQTALCWQPHSLNSPNFLSFYIFLFLIAI
jgi:hypothetical protein